MTSDTRHDVHNTGDEPMRLATVYAPPEHPAGTVHHTKADAQAA
jgi:mannose-6-phosphate isomerase-like protein (cupin superfamily)